MSRIKARETVMISLYQMEIHQEFKITEQLKNQLYEKIEDPREIKYALNILNAVIDNKETIDQLIDEHSENWKVSRISKIDLSIIRLSLAEMIFTKSVPDSISINEAIKLSKQYSDDDAFKFVNGILGKINRSQ